MSEPMTRATDAAIEAVEAYNANPDRPFDQWGDQKVYYRERAREILTERARRERPFAKGQMK
jgi:hypothetical protein